MSTKAPQKTVSQAGLELIRKAEEMRCTAYLCPARRVTIGYGHVILPKWDAGLFASLDSVWLKRMIDGCQRRGRMTQEALTQLRISAAQAEALLKSDVKQTALFINSVVRVELKQNQFDALASFIFNIGQGNYAESTLRKQLNLGDFSGVAAEFDRWVMGTVDGQKVKLPGLVTRRAAERALFEG